MKQFGKKFLAVVVCLTMIVSVFAQGGQVYAAKADNDTVFPQEYQIYPIPHEMTYQDGGFSIDSKVNVVYESKIDDVTKARLDDVLAIQDATASVTDAKKDGVTNILVGVYGSGEYVDTYVKANYSDIDTAVFNEYSGHYVISADDEIIVLGVDTDAAFYGITSLKHIFSQIETGTIRNFVIKDFADTSIRGFIEGYYGIPWSNEDRMSLMEFGGEFKMTSYVFAPKDDPYHTSKWRELYPADEIAAIKEMAELGNSVKCRFVWTAHPFMGGFKTNDVAGEIKALLAKFDQLYDAGVRQFGVLGDDVGSLNLNIVIQVMNAVSEWANAKGDVYDSVFCPAGYNHSWQGNYSELNTYDAGFPDDIQIFWTGEAVCRPVEQITLDHFRRTNATNGERRAPLFWLNWPVNDINHSRMLMGKGSQLKTDINVDDLVGVVTNPMQEAEASKVALFAVADYTWNVKAFDDDKSWADSFAYIDADATEELHTLAKHMSNPEPNGHGLVLAESEELQPLINEFKTALANGTSLAEVGAQLIDEMDVIIKACDDFNTKSKNENLKDELAPFIGSLKDLAASIKNYTAAAMALEADKDADAFDAYMAGVSAFESSKSHLKQGRDGVEVVDPGSTHLIPLAETIADAISAEIEAYVFGDAETPVVLTGSSSFNSFYAGSNANIVDGDPNTYAWYGGGDAAGQYYQVNLSRPATVYGVEILNGSTSAKPDDTFGSAKLQYTTDGSTWLDVPNGATTAFCQPSLTVEGIELENVTAVRYTCTQASGKWPSMREFTLQLEKAEGGKAYTNVDDYAEIETTIGTDLHEFPAVEGLMLEAGEYIGLKLDRIHELAAIDVEVSESGLTLQVSENSVEWQDVEAGAVSADARYIRLINNTDAAVAFNVTKFEVSTVEVEEKAVESTNYTSFSGDLAALFDNDWTTAYQFANSQTAGKYITIDLGSTITMNSFKAVCTDSEWDFARAAKFSVSADGVNWKEIMLMGNQDGPNPGEETTEDEIGFVLPDHEVSYNTKSVTDLNEEVRYLKFEITRTKVGADKWVRFQEFEINGGMYIPTTNDPTIEVAEEQADNQKGFMTDRVLSTLYTWTGDMIYHESEEARVDGVKIIQNGESGATLSVRFAGEEDFTEAGKLESSISEFTFEKEIVDIKISTAKETPCSVIEILTSASGDLPETPDVPVVPPVEEDEVTRLFGDSRYDTGYVVADTLKEVLGVEKFEAVVVATGKNFADALAGSYLAVEKNAPILLTNGKDDNIAELHAYIAANVAEGGKVYILGGEGAVPTAVDAIKGYEVVRLFGDSRYDTNLAILDEAGVAGDSIIVATGKNFADSLSASAAKLPILLVKPEAALNDAQKEVLTGMKNIYIVGGEGAVSAEYEEELAAFGEVTRVFGDSRYDTSVEIAKTFSKDVDFAVVASGKNFPDGLCGGPLAAALNAPLVLTKDGGASAAASYVAENEIASGFVLGGDGALADATVVEVFALESADEIK